MIAATIVFLLEALVVEAQLRPGIMMMASGPRLPIPISITFSPASPNVSDTSQATMVVATIAITMSNGSQYAGPTPVFCSSGCGSNFGNGGGLFSLTASSMTLAQNLTSANDGTYHSTIKVSQNGVFIFANITVQVSSGAACVNSGTNLCFLLGSFGPDLGSTSWMSRPWDFTDAGIGQNQCNFIAAGYPFEGGTDNPGITGTYQGQIAANSACPTRIYGYKINNEWWLNCNATNPWSTTQTTPGNCSGSGPPQWESVPATVSPATYKANVCAAVNLARQTFPGIIISWFGPGDTAEAAYDPSDTCQIDAYEVHLYVYGDNIPGRTAQGDWQGGTPYSCNPSAGVHNVLPGDIQCQTNTPMGFLLNYAKTAPHIKPVAFTEVCDGYNDTTGPGGISYATWAISELAKANSTSVIQWWSGDPDGTGQSDCSIRSGSGTNYLNKQAAMRSEFGGSHYAGTLYTYKTLPVPNPYP